MSFVYDNPQLEFESMRNAILSFYSPSSDLWQRVNAGAASEYEVLRAFSQMPQMQISRSASGSTVLGYDMRRAPLPTVYADDYYDEILSQINSNADDYAYSANAHEYNFPGYASYGGSGVGTGYNFIGGARDANGNMLATIADKASLAVTGVNLGAKLGMLIDEGIYNINPKWWDENFPTINPQTWADISMSEGGKSFIRTLFGIPNTGDPTAYVSADVLAYYYQMMRETGALNDGGYSGDYSGSTSQYVNPDNAHAPVGGSVSITIGNSTYTVTNNADPVYYYQYQISSGRYNINFVSKSSFRVTRSPSTYTWSSSAARTYNNTNYQTVIIPAVSDVPITYVYPQNQQRDVDTTIIDGTVTETPAIDGITKNEVGTTPDPRIITGTTTADVLQQLKQNYPQLFDGSITTATLQDDGTIKEDEYVPVPFANVDTLLDDRVVTGDATQTDLTISPDEFTRIPDKTTNPPDTGTGNQSPYVAPTGSASSLWAVYHPSQAQLNAFGAWLWSSDFVEQLKRLFNDPMQAIIGVHKVFAPIPTGGSQNIKCGYLDSGVSSPIVSSQYTEVSCGTVNCREYFGNVFDYDPHTRVSIYLPFIGVVPLKVSEVMRASITVTYGVDVITGACLAKVKVDRDGGGAILYSFGGSCACHYPISAGSYAGIISGIVTSAVGVAGGIMSGNPLAAVGGVLAGARQAHTEVQHSGGFTGCAGAMGPKIPYLIITRPQTRMADDVQLYEGKPSNATQFIGDCTGFVRAVEVHFSSQAAFDDEAKEVEALLKSGVLISG